ncbi:MAG: hypothetical protein JWQ22_1467 [Devosia sp.]|nr:hypothetical protein [Devosia sp.]
MILDTTHLMETALLLLAAYLLGCVLGYGIRRVLYAARGTRQVTAIATPVAITALSEIKRIPSPAARLAARVDEPMLVPPTVSRPRIIQPPVSASRSKPMDRAPAALLAPRGIADNLKQIKGVGPKIETSLNSLGIYHFDQIAGWTKANVDWVDDQLAFKGRIGRERWVEQATKLAKVNADA